jgi:WD40 repeat protein
VRTGRRLAAFRGGDGENLRSFRGVDIDASDKRLIAVSVDGLDGKAGGPVAHFIRLWDMETGRLLRRWQVTPNLQDRPEEGAVRAVVSPDGHTVAVGKISPEVGLWDVASGLHLMTLDLEDGGAIKVLRFSPDGKALVAAAFRGNARLFRVR